MHSEKAVHLDVVIKTVLLNNVHPGLPAFVTWVCLPYGADASSYHLTILLVEIKQQDSFEDAFILVSCTSLFYPRYSTDV